MMRLSSAILRRGLVLSSRWTTQVWRIQAPTMSMNQPIAGWRGYSSSSESPSMKHQEIEGPTVERDMSEVAKETREVTENLMKTMYGTSKVVAAVGMSQLLVGAYLMKSDIISSSNSVAMMSSSVVGFAFPFCAAFMMRRSLKSMQFFNKMEQMGRLQLITSNMQNSKHLLIFFIRLRSLSYLSVAALSLPLSYTLFYSLTH